MHSAFGFAVGGTGLSQLCALGPSYHHLLTSSQRSAHITMCPAFFLLLAVRPKLATTMASHSSVRPLRKSIVVRFGARQSRSRSQQYVCCCGLCAVLCRGDGVGAHREMYIKLTHKLYYVRPKRTLATEALAAGNDGPASREKETYKKPAPTQETPQSHRQTGTHIATSHCCVAEVYPLTCGRCNH